MCIYSFLARQAPASKPGGFYYLFLTIFGRQIILKSTRATCQIFSVGRTVAVGVSV